MTPKPHGKSVLRKSTVTWPKRGTWTDLACPLTKPKIVLNFKKDSSDRFPVEHCTLPTLTPRRAPSKTPNHLQTKRASPSGCLSALDSRSIQHHLSRRPVALFYVLQNGNTRKVSTDDKADYRYPHGELPQVNRGDECSSIIHCACFLVLLNFTQGLFAKERPTLLLPWTTSRLGQFLRPPAGQDTAHRCPRQARRAL